MQGKQRWGIGVFFHSVLIRYQGDPFQEELQALIFALCCQAAQFHDVIPTVATFITPIDREDIHLINSSQETILNHIQAISNRIGVYEFTRMRFPAQRMVSNVKDMVTAIGVLLGMLENKGEVADYVGQVKHQKKECEMLLLSGLGELYDSPNTSPAELMEIIKWTHVYDRIDKAFNRAWQLAKAIEGVVLKNA